MNTNQGDGVRVRGPGTWLAEWASDLRLGVRLAIGGGRTSKTGVARLVLGTIGIGLAVAVLLVGASAGPMFGARDARQNAQAQHVDRIPGVDALWVRSAGTDFRDRDINGEYLHASGPSAPLPPGLDRLPGDDEIFVSQALRDLLDSPEGELLRPRFPQRVVGTIGPQGVTDAGALTFYAGDSSLDRDSAQPVYGYGTGDSDPMPASLAVLIAIGTVVLLVPVFVFVATSARIAGAERDRRLAALRLVGVDSLQARRIAAAESLASAVTGLAFGIGLFLLFRSLVGNFPILGVRPYPSDVAPPWPLVLLILVLVPGLAVVTAQVALRRTIIEPLGVVRMGRAIRRKLWWRLIPVVLGPALLLSEGDVSSAASSWVPRVVVGAALLLIGIPLLLPWLLERAVARVHGGRPAAQLAFRRLQLDSGTPARVVSGVSVVLAGAIALQAVLSSQTGKYETAAYSLIPLGVPTPGVPAIIVSVEGEATDMAADRIRAVPGVESAVMARQLNVRTESGDWNSLTIVDCAALLRFTTAGGCADGDVFQLGREHPGLSAGETVTLLDYSGYTGDARDVGRWTVPGVIRPVQVSDLPYPFGGSLLTTPGALRGVDLPLVSATVAVWADTTAPDVAEHVRNALAPYGWRTSVQSTSNVSGFFLPESLELFLTIQNALLGGALFTLLLAGVSMLVLALEQVRERRRPLAALAATGVPTGTLARSLLWQNTFPVLVGVAVAVLTGIGLAALVFRLIDEPFTMDWLSVGMFSGVAAVLVLLVTASTLPTLRSATRLAALRSE